MDEKKKMILAAIGVVVAISAAIFVGSKTLTSEKEQIVGSLDGTGPGATGPVKGMKDGQPAVGGENQPPPANVEGGRGQ